MTTAVATAPSFAVPRDQGLTSLAHLAASAPPMVTTGHRTTPPGRSGQASAEQSPRSAPRTSVEDDVSPHTNRSHGPAIKVKKEPSSPHVQSSTRPRPRRLDLSAGASGARAGPQSARPSGSLTAKDSAGLAIGIHDLGVACLSPGFQTQDPERRQYLERSLDVREQQRRIIEARQKGTSIGTSVDGSETAQRTAEGGAFGPPARGTSTSRRKGPPAGLSITAPSAAAFANERVIQSAPLHQSFTGFRGHAYPHQPSHLSQTSHIHHVPAAQSGNRLPPISDVFANDSLPAPPSTSFRSGMFATGQSPSNAPAPMQSPGYAASNQGGAPQSARTREFRSAEEAVREMSRGREELLPKIVHYGGAQPPTPPSPMPSHHQHQQQQQYPHQQHHHHHQQAHHNQAQQQAQQQHHHQAHSYPLPQPYSRQAHPQSHGPPSGHHEASRPEYAPTSGRRRTREEYERDNGSPLGQHEPKRSSFHHVRDDGEPDWRAGMSGPEKREAFLEACARAWDLFHS